MQGKDCSMIVIHIAIVSTLLMLRLLLRSRSPRWMAIALMTLILTSSPLANRVTAAEPAKPVLPANLRAVNIWKRVLGNTKLSVPWRANPCDSNAPLLCVSYQGAFVGTVEMGTYLVETRADLRQKLLDAGIPAKSDYSDPKFRSRVTAALKAWVEDYYKAFKQDRTTEYGNKIAFTTQSPTEVTIGKLTGLRYGFSGVKRANEGIHEQHIGYVAFDGTTLYVITTAFDAASETGKFKVLADLQRFEPQLKQLVAGLQLPIAKPLEQSPVRQK